MRERRVVRRARDGEVARDGDDGRGGGFRARGGRRVESVVVVDGDVPIGARVDESFERAECERERARVVVGVERGWGRTRGDGAAMGARARRRERALGGRLGGKIRARERCAGHIAAARARGDR